ncbi:MAG: 30S ribosomal protein S8 [Patescibacteria group bacterium]
MVRDLLSDFLVRIRNAQAVGRGTTMVPYSALTWEVAKLLEREGYIGKSDRRGKRARKMIEVELVYADDKRGRIEGTRRVSKQARRVYRKSTEMQPFRHRHGLQIISTSKGLMTSMEARRGRIGGEVLFEIW